MKEQTKQCKETVEKQDARKEYVELFRASKATEDGIELWDSVRRATQPRRSYL